MAKLIEVPVESFPDARMRRYRTLAPLDWAALLRGARELRGKSVVHVSATARGGGVAELLKSQVAFERALGVDSHWLTIRAHKKFFKVTKKIHNLLQGKQTGMLSTEEEQEFLGTGHELGESLGRFLGLVPPGAVVIHDAQPLLTIRSLPSGFVACIRMHVDLSTPNVSILEWFKPFMLAARAMVVSNKGYFLAFPWLPKRSLKVIYPAIDPLSEKNLPMSERAACAVLSQFGVNCARPLLTQVSRFDPWKDPLGVIKAYYTAKNQIPDLQLALAGFMLAQDDPEAAEVYARVKKHAQGDPHIYLFADPRHLRQISGDQFISALYTASAVVMQKSIREGFGLTVTEAMWKGKPVVAGKTSGTSIQVRSGVNGLLVASPEEAARATVRLLKNRSLRRKLGGAARLSVKKNFLLPRYISDHLKLYQAMLGEKHTGRARRN